jgi:short-subunit dehydrogenase
MKVKDKVIVVTGGGNGIGRAVVLNLLNKGARVAAIDINATALQETVEVASLHRQLLSTHVANITDFARIEQLPNEILEHHHHIDGIINVAGIIQPFVKVESLDYEKIKRVMDVNFYGTLFMVKTFLPFLKERPEAHIVNVSSMGGFVPVPGQTIYGASKAAVKLLTEGLHSELRDTHVHVTVVFPGGVKTNITENSNAAGNMNLDASKAAAKLLTADEAAEIIIKGMEKNQYRVLAGSDAKIMDFLYRFSPKKAAGMIAKMMKKYMNI